MPSRRPWVRAPPLAPNTMPCVAQLAERTFGRGEAAGSIPAVGTKHNAVPASGHNRFRKAGRWVRILCAAPTPLPRDGAEFPKLRFTGSNPVEGTKHHADKTLTVKPSFVTRRNEVRILISAPNNTSGGGPAVETSNLNVLGSIPSRGTKQWRSEGNRHTCLIQNQTLLGSNPRVATT